ncbi:MAG: DUF167 domain-containing protein [Bacteroidia bacterium]|jgi:uncharacterized protein YggU (UPF0235/DUF167 family)|nr:DUF167 domain-containing protein [Bacteroidota bacterium]MBK7430428.1 DUF167 domain-containing protein [Bacteroidota bacterium]MBP9923589.1 DUF167 domain-containing protein [Bacteroidia bacterium]
MLLYLKVKPNQRFDRIEQTTEGWQVRLHAPAVDGKANDHLISYLSDVLKLPKSAIQLKKGLTNKFKCLEINCDETTVLEMLELESKK